MSASTSASHPFDSGRNGVPTPIKSSATTKLQTSPKMSTPPFNTSVAMTVTPASAAVSAASSSSTRSSPMNHLHALQTQAMPSPDLTSTVSPHAQALSSPSTSISAVADRKLAEHSPSLHSRPSTTHSMADPIAATKSPGLIRRISQGGYAKLRHRPSYQHSLRMRDQSAGPVIIRRRSDSNANSDVGQDVSDLELDDTQDSAVEYPPHSAAGSDHQNALGINIGRPSDVSVSFEGGTAPAISAVLTLGTWVTKYGPKSKKAKRIKIWLDPSSARVCWHSSNPAKSFFIDDVEYVLKGVESRNARDDIHIPPDHESRSVKIGYIAHGRSQGRNHKTMLLVMDLNSEFQYWTEALSYVNKERTAIMNALASSKEKSEQGMQKAWAKAMERKPKNAEPTFTLDDAKWLCRQLEINCSEHAVRTHFATADRDHSEKLDYARFKDFVNTFKERKDIQHLFTNISYGTDIDIDLNAFLAFLKNDQHVDVDRDRTFWESVFDKFAGPAQNKAALPDATPVEQQRTLTPQSFQSFLSSAYNSALAPSKGETTFDRPLNEYFISSSHNTYLLGRQIAGVSSAEGYISALIKGCRCIEIDCWDGDSGRPMVTHGKTMTTKIPFEDCVSIIAKYAFHASTLPLIVSLEVHCNAEQQKAMVDLMMRYWAKMIITEPITLNTQVLPSPEELRGRILVKVKAAEDRDPAQQLTDAINSRSRATSLGSNFVRTPSIEKSGYMSVQSLGSPAPTSPSETNVGSMSTPRDSSASGPTVTPSSSADDSDDNLMSPEKSRKRKLSKIISVLGSLGVYTQGIKFPGGFHLSESKTPNHVFSFAESTFTNHCKNNNDNDNKAALEEHNMHYLMRVYPMARRVDSSNFDPIKAWKRGVQMAAVNWQTYDVPQQINEAMFGACSDRLGYVLKPEELRFIKHVHTGEPNSDPPQQLSSKACKKVVRFTVDIVSAQRLPRPKKGSLENGMNPYIEFEVYSPEDKARGIAHSEGGTDASARDGSFGIGSPIRKRTKIVEGNGFDPIYNQQITNTLETKHPDLIFVRWTVWHAPERQTRSNNNILLATFTAKLSSLQQGYRHLPLFNTHGEQYRDAKLFVRIHKEIPFSAPASDHANGKTEATASPRPEAARADRSWRRVFSRNSSQRRKPDTPSEEMAGFISRTSSVDRESTR